MNSEATVLPRYSFYEELANSITHGVGLLLAIAGLGVLTAFASVFGTVWHIVSCSIYAGTMIMLYMASTLYHSIPWEKAKAVFRILDHSSIFLLIAGTYTPFTLVSLRGPWGWWLFGTIWGLAVVGILMEIFLPKNLRFVTIGFYVAMGWTIVVAIKPMLAVVAPGGLMLLLAGGLCYTLGVPFYIKKSIPFNHAIWHLFVLAGTIFQFFSILLYVIPVFSN
ncbi:PAQR family membrane homeostasis protein TrhA [Desulfosediminicola flagellatus]|uniref:PAQR family membrane homeostasis protein TrhA n=1 Tax=Desulfosediminicola flagellatus TaxID=2569541 RepID=UPI0010ACFB27|nr:hemolysin III family protein [Desulfosediminicola flagellatus]